MIKNILILSLLTIVTWLIHVVLVWAYLPHFPSTKSMLFRLAHVTEIGILISLLLTLHSPPLSKTAIIITILGTLLVVDVALFAGVKSLREQFDIWHFIAVYSVIVLAVIVFR